MKIRPKIRRGIKISLLFLFFGIILFLGIKIRNLLFEEMQRRLSSLFTYSEVKVVFAPPGLVFKNIRLAAETPFFAAQKLTVRTSWLAFFSSKRPLRLFIEEPRIRYSRAAGERTRKGFSIPVPFVLEEVLIKGGEVSLFFEKESIQAEGLKAFLKQRGDKFVILAEGEKTNLVLGEREVASAGRLKLSLEAKDRQIEVKQCLLEEQGKSFKVKGLISNLTNPEVDLKCHFWLSMSSVAHWLKLPLDWEGQVTSHGRLQRQRGKWFYQAEVESPNLSLNDYFLGGAKGSLDWRPSEKSSLHVQFMPQGRRRDLVINWGDGKINGKAEGFPLDPVMREFGLPWPVKSLAWVNFSMADDAWQVTGEFRENDFSLADKLYPLHGPFEVGWGKQKVVKIFSPGLLSNIARFQVDGYVEVPRSINFKLKAEIIDLKATRLFLEDLLQKHWDFPEIRGQAETVVTFSGSPSSPEINLEFEGSPVGFSQFNFVRASGQARISSGQLTGNFHFQDPELTGRVRVKADAARTEADFLVQEGNWEKILPATGVRLPLQGKMSGDFQLAIKERVTFLSGNFLSPRLFFVGQSIENASGKINWQENTFRLINFQGLLAGGSVAGQTSLDFSQDKYSLEVEAKSLSLEKIIGSIKGEVNLSLQGEGFFF